MDHNIQIFENEHFGKIRGMDINGNPWFVAKDVAIALGYSNPLKAIRDKVDDEDKGVNKTFTPGGTQPITVINESGLYCLILSSKLPAAKAFKRWVTSEVLPSIRKHGAYITDELLDEIAANKEAAEKLFRDLKAEKEKSRGLEEQLEVNEPKCEFYDNVLQAEGLMPMTLIAKDYGISATRLNSMLYAFGVQYKMHCGTWVLYADYQDLGYTQTVTIFPRYDYNNPRLVMYWTHAGREFLYRFLKVRGIVPVTERETDTI